MITLVKGTNIALAELSAGTGIVSLSVAWAAEPGSRITPEVTVLLLGPDGTVRGREDVVSRAHRVTADGAVRLVQLAVDSDKDGERISVALKALPADVDRVVVAASLDGRGDIGFGAVPGVHLILADQAGRDLLRFDVSDASTERAYIVGELYRRNGAWKFRAVGQGYEHGLAALAADFGAALGDPASTRTAPAARANIPASRRPRAPKARKVASPVAGRKLAGADTWRPARLFSTAGIGSRTEQEVRATTSLLAVLAQVKDFGRALTTGFGAPAGLVESYTEVEFRNGDVRLRPDGVIRVARAGRVWTALVEVKTAGNALRRDQVDAYLDLAVKEGFQAIVTVSNDLAPLGSHPVAVDRRKLRRVNLCHLSWAEIRHEAEMLLRYHGLPESTQAWVLSEFVEYLRHPQSGCGGLESMGSGWVTLRSAVKAGTLRQSDRAASQVAECWDKLVRQVGLRLTTEVGAPITVVLPRRLAADPAARIAATVNSLVAAGRMTATFRVPGTDGPLTVTADLRVDRIETAVTVTAPDNPRQSTRVRWLLRQLPNAPDTLRVETVVRHRGRGACELLATVREAPEKLVREPGEEIAAFVLTGSARLGPKRGTRGSTDAAGFIGSVDAAVDAFYVQVVRCLTGDRSATSRDPSA
jgi:stress response protein SCP2